jgi:hypothetical protein
MDFVIVPTPAAGGFVGHPHDATVLPYVLAFNAAASANHRLGDGQARPSPLDESAKWLDDLSGAAATLLP